jgi:sugar lactone lactonase YvrE
MPAQFSRYPTAPQPGVAAGWRLEPLTPPSRLSGANGVRTGSDGRIYIAQCSGSQVSAMEIETGAVEAVSATGGAIIGPDDLAFDAAGVLYATEVTEGRVSARTPGGATRVVRGDLPAANPITVRQGRLIVGECRPGGRIMELDLDGGAPRLLLEDVPMPNAFEVGPDGLLYFPVMAANEIWRVSLDGGPAERVVGDLGVPDSVKFDSAGRIVSTQLHSGQVLRIDPRTGGREVLADIGPGLDNLTFVGERLFVSRITGEINEVLAGGRLRNVAPGGFNWPLGLAVDADGAVIVADGPSCYRIRPGEPMALLSVMASDNFPGYLRGIAASGPGEFIVANGVGEVVRWRPAQGEKEILADGFNVLYGVAVSPTGGVVVADGGAGRVISIRSGQVEALASGLEEPMGVALGSDGSCYVSEAAGGRVVRLSGGQGEIVLDGLVRPHGIALHGGRLFVLDAGARQVVEYDLELRKRRLVAENLPVGGPGGVVRQPLRGFLPFVGPWGHSAASRPALREPSSSRRTWTAACLRCAPCEAWPARGTSPPATAARRRRSSTGD